MDVEDGVNGSGRGTVLRWVGGIVALLCLLLVILWTQRQPLAENFIGRELNRLDVRARYDVTSIGLRTQRIENIVLGDPARPDLTARWAEVDIAFSGVSPKVAAVRAGGVRLYGRLHEGVLTLGEADKFRDPTSTAPFNLPDIALALSDARMRLDTDAGTVGMRIDGSGNLRSGFRGKLAVTMADARFGDCGLAGPQAYVDIAMNGGRPHIKGPVRADALGCRAAGLALSRPVMNADVTLSSTLDRWTGRADLVAEALRTPKAVAAKPRLRLSFDGTAKAINGRVRLNAEALGSGSARSGPAELSGAWTAGFEQGETRFSLNGGLSAHELRLAGADPLAGLRASAGGTPLAPLAVKLADAVQRAGRANVLRSRFAVVQKGKNGSIAVTAADFSSRSGAHVRLGDGGRFTLAWPGSQWALDGGITVAGGGLPRAALRLARRPGGGFGGQLFVDDYSAEGARLTLEPVRFVAGAGGETRFTTLVRLDGPLPGGGVRGLRLPVEGVLRATGALAINRRCVPLEVTSLRYAGLQLGQSRVGLCPSAGGALLAFGPRGLSGGGVARAVRLSGTLGGSPLRMQAGSFGFALASPGFEGRDVELLIGQPEAPVRLAMASLTGSMGGTGLDGRLANMTARIGTVPLLVSDAAGQWQFRQGALRIDGALTLSDIQQPSRFQPLVSRDFTLTLRDNRITAAGALLEPQSGATILLADIRHDLGTGEGHADLDVPGVGFTEALQPEAVTRLALGVVANVRGTVTGRGQVRWTGTRVTSDGVFRTDAMDLAAAFGPVTGASGEVRFTDLLGLVTAPGQVLRLATVNPGIEVRDGILRYQLIPGQRVQIEGGEWPFSGGRLSLLPTVLDFGAERARNLTFRVVGLDAGAFINTLDLKNISATGTFDGLLPMIFDAQGGRIRGGLLVARQAGRPPLVLEQTAGVHIPCDPARQAGTLAYVGEVSNADLGVFGKLAFDALKNLQYKCLTIVMDGALDGEIVTQVSFNGVNRGQIGDAPPSIARSFIGLPFLFNIRIEAPFRGLLNTAQSFIDPSLLIRSQLGDQFAPVMETAPNPSRGIAVQPAESDNGASGDSKRR